VFAGLRNTTGARVIVDSSKHPAEAYLLSVLPQLDLHVLHLVRDPRAVAYSWSRKVAETGDARGRRLDDFGALTSSAWWLAWNATIDALLRPRLGARYLRLRYEDLTARPADAVRSISAFLAEPREPPPFVDGHTVPLSADHTVAGNPRARFRHGPVELRADEEWRSRLPVGPRTAATLVTAPLLRRYGYRVTG
jgi:hypothetical protein